MVYVFLADGFEEMEAIGVIDILRRAELDVVCVGVTGNIVTGSHGISLLTEDTADSIEPGEDIKAVVLPGGMPGTLNLDKSKKVHEFLDFAAEHNILIAAICAAPSVLGRKGLLKGKSAVCFPGYENLLEGAELKDEAVVECGGIITGKGPGVTTEFALKIVEVLCGSDKSDNIRKALQCRQ